MTDHATETTPQKGKDDKPDPREIGYVFPYPKGNTNTPYDYLVSPDTGKTMANQVAVWGVAMEDLRDGIEGCVIPPLFTWRLGVWLTDIQDGDWPITALDVHESKGETWEQNVWIVNGEGTPGAFAFRAYLLPTTVANIQVPKHPLMWRKKLKEGKSRKFTAKVNWRWSSAPSQWDGALRYQQSWELLKEGVIVSVTTAAPWRITGRPPVTPQKPPTPSTQVATTKSSLPTGVRFRCPGCGHWYTETNLASHIRAGICPGTDTELDMATMCDKECGCSTLDEAARAKPGFPRQAKLPKPKEEVKPATASENGKSAVKDKQLSTSEVTTPAGGTK